jgi:cob(I)alamin adenosyltransferase
MPGIVCSTAMTVNLTRIYTRLGDRGETHLGDMSRVPKTHPRIEAYGTVDELNSLIGVALTLDGVPGRYAEWLRRVQNDLFDVGADVSVPEGGERERLRVRPEQVEWLEQACDEVNATLEPLKSFVLPGGTPLAAHLHVARTVCRRAERRALDVGDELNPEVVRYLNRLSDLLFILSRGANAEGGGAEPLWEPGGKRDEPPDQAA